MKQSCHERVDTVELTRGWGTLLKQRLIFTENVSILIWASLNLESCFHIFRQQKILKKWSEMLFIFVESSSRSRDIQILLLSPFLFFSPVGQGWIYWRNWLKINPKVYDIVVCKQEPKSINCLKAHPEVWDYFWQVKALTWKLFSF